MNVQNNQIFITLDTLGADLKVLVRYSNKSKRIVIKINHGEAELVLPNKKFEEGHKFLLKKESWIRKKLEDINNIDSTLWSNKILIWGKSYLLKYIISEHFEILINDNVMFVYSPEFKHMDNLKKFLKDKLLDQITLITSSLSQVHNIKFTKIRIMNNKSRWGSCSSKAVLSFNIKLIFAPKEILRYIVIHEICHIMEMNHSQRFWNLVSTIDPNYKSSELWLKQNSHLLNIIANKIFKPQANIT